MDCGLRTARLGGRFSGFWKERKRVLSPRGKTNGVSEVEGNQFKKEVPTFSQLLRKIQYDSWQRRTGVVAQQAKPLLVDTGILSWIRSCASHFTSVQ